MNEKKDKVYKRKFENCTLKQLSGLIRRTRWRKFGFKETWFEVEENLEGKFSGILFYKL